MSPIRFLFLPVFKCVSIVAAIFIGAQGVAADLSDEQIEREISRMEEQAAQARKSETAIVALGAGGASMTAAGANPDPKPSQVAKTALEEENQIPVFAESKKASVEKDEHTLTRLSLSLGVLALVGLGSLFLIRRYSQNRRENAKHTQIQILTQHHLGPKKTLTIVRVAGESLLLGVTDNSISLIKSLALIDDEFPEVSNEPFGAEIKKRTAVSVRREEEEIEASDPIDAEDVEEFQMGSAIPRSENRSGGRRWLT